MQILKTTQGVLHIVFNRCPHAFIKHYMTCVLVEKLQNTIQNTFHQQHSTVEHMISKWFPVKSALRQECVLSPLLFIVYVDRITQEANPDPETQNELLFADDQFLINHSIQGLEDHTDRLHAECLMYGMSIMPIQKP